jgi:Rod binding domain-containing protein
VNLKLPTTVAADGQSAQPRAEDPANKKRLEAARQFEGILMRQLLSVMRNTAKSGGMMNSSGASAQYMTMFDEAVADKMAEGGGIGLADSFVTALGGQPEAKLQAMPGRVNTGMPKPQGGVERELQRSAATLPSLHGATARLAQAAYAISAPEGGKQWSRDGTLTERDLASDIETPTAGGIARFAVRDAQGYRDAYKCNLFAFEAARRGGFEVPVVARAHGYGFPTSNTVTQDAADGTLRGDWAEVVPTAQIGELKDKVARGEVALMLTGSGSDGRHGHMAVVEKIHEIELDADGAVKRIEFDGYEARVDGAQHLTRRSWNIKGNGADSKLARNGFGTIELLALRPAERPQAPEVRLSDTVRASRPKTY